MWHLFSRKKHQSSRSNTHVAVDLHSHLIPGIDDGAKSYDDALHMIRCLIELGFSKCITTPHIYEGIFNNTAASIAVEAAKLKQRITSEGIPFELTAAAEYFFDNHFFEYIEKRELLTFGDSYVLFELPMKIKPPMLGEIITRLKEAGYKPVLAHVERYSYFYDKRMIDYKQMKRSGVFFQLNLMSLTGYYNTDCRRAARELIKNDMFDFVGSDLHRQKQIPIIAAALQDKYFEMLLTSGRLLNETL